MLPILISQLHRKFHQRKFRFILALLLASALTLSVWYVLLSVSVSLIMRSDKDPRNNAEALAGEENKGLRILCYVPITRKKLRVAEVIRQTWGSRCDALVFFGSFDINGQSKYEKLNVVSVNGTDNYDLLWGKTKRMLVHLDKMYGNNFDWFVKADDDTFVILENLKRFIRENVETDMKKSQPAWFGYKMFHKKMKHPYMSGGAGYAINAAALQTFAQLVDKYNGHQDYVVFDPKTMERPDGCKTATDEGIEDLELGRCFHSLGIKSIDTIDSEGRHRFLPLSLERLMSTTSISPEHWIWSQSWFPLKLGEKCCSDSMIAIHEVTETGLKVLNYLLYKVKISSD